MEEVSPRVARSQSSDVDVAPALEEEPTELRRDLIDHLLREGDPAANDNMLRSVSPG